MQSNNPQDWWTYHPLSISWRIHHKIPLPGESHRSVGWRESRPATQLTADAEVIYLIQERGGLTIRNLHSSLVRWRLCCWGHLVLLLGYSGAAPAGWSWSYCSHSGSRSVQLSPRSWTEYQWIQMGGVSMDYPNINMSALDLTKSYIFRKKSQSVVPMMYDSSDMNGDLFQHRQELTQRPADRWQGSRHIWRPPIHGPAALWLCWLVSPHLHPSPWAHCGYLSRGRQTHLFTYSISALTAQQTTIHILIHFEWLLHNCALSRKRKHTNSFGMECPIIVHLQKHVKATLLLLPPALWNYRSGCADTNSPLVVGIVSSGLVRLEPRMKISSWNAASFSGKPGGRFDRV